MKMDVLKVGLGWVNFNGERVFLTLFTIRAPGMELPGGVVIVGTFDMASKTFDVREGMKIPDRLRPRLAGLAGEMELINAGGNPEMFPPQFYQLTATKAFFVAFREEGLAPLAHKQGFTASNENPDWGELFHYQRNM